MTIIRMIIKTMLMMMMMRGTFHRLLATLVPDTHISSGIKSTLWWWWFLSMVRKVLMEVILKVVRSDILNCRSDWLSQYPMSLLYSSEVRWIFRMFTFTEINISSFSEVWQNAKNEDEDNLCCNPKDGRWCLTSGGKMISIHRGVPSSCARRHQGCKGFLQN